MPQVSTRVSWQPSKASLSRPCLPVGLRNPGSEVSVFSGWWSKKSNQVAVRGDGEDLLAAFWGCWNQSARRASDVWILTQSPTAGRRRLPVLSEQSRPVGPDSYREGTGASAERRGKTARKSERPKASYKNDAGHGARSHRLTCRQEKAHRNRFPRDPGPGCGCCGPGWGPYGKHFRQLAARVLWGH